MSVDPHPMTRAVSPAERLFGVGRLVADDGAEIARLRPPPGLRDADGSVPAGLLFLLADTVLGLGGLAGLPHEQWMVTTTMQVDVWSRQAAHFAEVLGRGSLVAAVDGGVVSSAVLTDEVGIAVAGASGRFAVLDGPLPSHPHPPAPDAGDTAAPSVESLDALLGLRIVESLPSSVRTTFHASPWLANDRGGVHGGVGALVGERVATVAVRAALSDGRVLVPTQMRATFLRPLASTGDDLVVLADIAHLGRSVGVVRSVLHTPDQRPAVLVDLVYAPPG